MEYRSTCEVAQLLGVSVGGLTRALWERRVHRPRKSPSGTFLWTAEDIHRASWVMRGRDADDVLVERNEVEGDDNV